MKTLPSHFDGRRFRNLVPRRNGFGALLRWLLTRRRGQWRAVTNAGPAAIAADEFRSTAHHLHQSLHIPAASRRHQHPHRPHLVGAGQSVELDRPAPRARAGHHHGAAAADRPGAAQSRSLRPHGPSDACGDCRANTGPRFTRACGTGASWRRQALATSSNSTGGRKRRRAATCGSPPSRRSTSRGAPPLIATKRFGAASCCRPSSSPSTLPATPDSGPHIEEIARAFRRSICRSCPSAPIRPEWFMGEVHMSPQDAVDAHLDAADACQRGRPLRNLSPGRRWRRRSGAGAARNSAAHSHAGNGILDAALRRRARGASPSACDPARHGMSHSPQPSALQSFAGSL